MTSSSGAESVSTDVVTSTDSVTPADAGTPGYGAATVAGAIDSVSEDAPGRAPAAVDEPPPFLWSWRNVYLMLIAETALLVILFYILTRWAS